MFLIQLFFLMEEIEVNIKLAANNKIYNLPIKKSETILKLKEYCHIISNIPSTQQNLLYKGKMLSNEKLIKDYDIENNCEIILVKTEEQKNVNIQQFSDNKELNPKEIAKAFGQIPDLLSFCEKMDLYKIANYFQLTVNRNSSGPSKLKTQVLKNSLKDPSTRYYIKNINKDPSFAEEFFSKPKIQKDIQDIPILRTWLQHPEIYLTPQNFQKILNMFKEDEKNIIESSNIGISVPPDPFGSLNNNQNIQTMNSSGQISNINFFNNNSIGNKKIFGNNEIDIDYKKEYKNQLSQLKDMGFTNEETNIQALKYSKGNINNAIEMILKYN